MISVLILAVGLAICVGGILVLSFQAKRPPYRDEIPERSTLYAVAFLILFMGDLFLQTYQLDGARQPRPIALVDGAVTSAIFCVLSLYAGSLVGRRKLSRHVTVLAITLFVLASCRSLLFGGAYTGVSRGAAISLDLAWLATAVLLAIAVAVTASRDFKLKAERLRERSDRVYVSWPTMLVAILWSTAILMIIRAAFAPWLGALPTLAAALDSPFIDTLYVAVFVLSGVATGGLRRAREPAAEEQPDDASVERWDRILQKADLALDQHFTNPELSMPKLAALIGSTEHRLSAALNRRRGVSFFAYVNERRIRAAMDMMRRGDTTVGEVAYQCGYNARSTFYVAFKSVVGESVQDWRRRVVDAAKVSGSADSDTSARITP